MVFNPPSRWNVNCPEVRPEFGAALLQTSTKPVTRTSVNVTRVSPAGVADGVTGNDVVVTGTVVVAPLEFVVTLMPLISYHGAVASVTVASNVPPAPGVPATRIGAEHRPARTLIDRFAGSTAPGTLKPNDAPFVIPAPAVLQTSM